MSRADKIVAWFSELGNSGAYYFGHGFDVYQGNSAIVWLCVLMLVWCLEATRLTTKFDIPKSGVFVWCVFPGTALALGAFIALTFALGFLLGPIR